jgi:hypothetical protein
MILPHSIEDHNYLVQTPDCTVVIVSAVWYNHMSVLGSCDFLRCVV